MKGKFWILSDLTSKSLFLTHVILWVRDSWSGSLPGVIQAPRPLLSLVPPLSRSLKSFTFRWWRERDHGGGRGSPMFNHIGREGMYSIDYTQSHGPTSIEAGPGKHGCHLETHFPATNPHCRKRAWTSGGLLAISAVASLRKLKIMKLKSGH